MSFASEFPALDRAAPGEVVAALEKALGDDLISVVLFGSHARNEADEASDWDVLIIARNLPERLLGRYRLLKRILPPAWRGRTSILAKTPAEFEATLPPLYLWRSKTLRKRSLRCSPLLGAHTTLHLCCARRWQQVIFHTNTPLVFSAWLNALRNWGSMSTSQPIMAMRPAD